MRFAALLLAMTSACQWGQYCEGDWAVTPAEPANSKRQERVVAQVLPVESTAVDILFVIDDSGSMTDQQAQLGIWSKEMFSVLSGTGELPDLHIGVTSSSVAIPGLEGCASGAGGVLLTGSSTIKDRFLSDVAGPEGRIKNYDGELTEAFAKMARVGDGGCGFEQPFNAAKAALSSEGFLRDDALLLVVFVTDEDDCSASSSALFAEPYADACSDLGTITSYRCFEHGVKCADGKGSRELGERTNCTPDETSPYTTSVAGFAQHLKKLKKFPAQTIVAGIYGKPNGVFAIPDERVERVMGYTTPRLADVCGGHGEEGTGATPGIRVNSLLAEFGGRASQSSICEPELSWAMRDLGLVTRGAAKRSRCLRGGAIEPSSCRVEAAIEVAGIRASHRAIAPCKDASDTHCFTIDPDPTCDGSQLAFSVREPIGPSETLSVRCELDVEAAMTSAPVQSR